MEQEKLFPDRKPGLIRRLFGAVGEFFLGKRSSEPAKQVVKNGFKKVEKAADKVSRSTRKVIKV